jgi:hypothetical protein
MVMAIAALGHDPQRFLSLVSHGLAALFAPRHLARATRPRAPRQADLLEAARARYHSTRAAYMRIPSAPGTAEEREFRAAFLALDQVRFGPAQQLPAPSPQLHAAALRAARLRATMAGRIEPDLPSPAKRSTRLIPWSQKLRRASWPATNSSYAART